MKIVALAGRKGSGKSTISRYLIANENFKKISFADFLKDLIIDVFLLDKKYLYDQTLKETKIFNIYTDLDFYKKISNYIQEDLTYLFKSSILIETPRQLLQFVGTDVLRAHDTDFHVKKTLLKIKENPNVNFVCDDLRFPNELSGLRSLDVEEYFVIRPNNWNISNHESETSIHWSSVNNQIVNDCDINFLISNFKNRYSNSSKYNKIVKNNFDLNSYTFFNVDSASPNEAFIGGFICQHKTQNNLQYLEIDSIKKYLIDLSIYSKYIYNYFELENLKMWLDNKILPKKHLESWERGRIYYKSLL